jgi:hypothetical protein
MVSNSQNSQKFFNNSFSQHKQLLELLKYAAYLNIQQLKLFYSIQNLSNSVKNSEMM